MSKKLFFTKFGWDSISEQEISRKIKLFSLLNNELIIPSNHLYSLNAEKILLKSPELLEYGLIKPALSSSFQTFSEYLNSRESKAKRNLTSYGEFLDSLNCQPEYYANDSPAKIFTNTVKENFSQPLSIVKKAAGFGFDDAMQFMDLIEARSKLNNEVVYYQDFIEISNQVFRGRELEVVLKFGKLVRYISGASSKNCSNLLPQENLIDWCLANYENTEQFVLNDEIIFWEIFLESMTKVTDGIFTLSDLQKISPNILDRYSYEDIRDFKRNTVQQQKFIEKYDKIIGKINSVGDENADMIHFLDYTELIKIKEKVKTEFLQALESESSLYKELEIIEGMLKVTYQLWGGALQSIESVVNFFSVVFDQKKSYNKFLKRQENRIQKASKYASSRLSGEPVLIEYMDMLTKKAKESWFK